MVAAIFFYFRALRATFCDFAVGDLSRASISRGLNKCPILVA